MESVQIRQRGAYDFETHYDSVCVLNSCCPLAAVKAHLSQGILDLNGDKISLPEWKPILSSVSINKSLEFIAVTSNHLITEKGKENHAPKSKHKQPAIRGKEVNHELCKAIKKCLLVSPALACLKLQGLPLRESDILYLAKGLNKNSSLNYLSLSYCKIGDNGLETIARAIKNNLTLNTINLTGCNLTSQGADIFARIIKHQALCRHGEAWKDSLRYRRPDLERMSGLRRITLNNNHLIGDYGALVLAEALQDDLWLKALDLQNCGITKIGAQSFNDMLLYNTTLVVLDIRANPMIDRMLAHSITEQVMLNAKAIATDNSKPEYDWIKLEPNKMDQNSKRKKKVSKTVNNSFTKKTSVKINGTRYNLKSSRSNSSLRSKVGSELPQPGQGVPWRMAARAVKQRGCFPNSDDYYQPDANFQEVIADTDPCQHQKTSTTHQPGVATPVAEKKLDKVRSPYSYKDHENISKGISMLKNLRVELEHTKRELSQERKARQESDKKVLELTLENQRLMVEVDQLRKKTSILDDEKVLEAVETSFKQFHSFLDVLRQAGFNDLIRVAGLDEKLPFNSPKVPSFDRTKPQLSDFHNRKSSRNTLTNSDSQHILKNHGYQTTEADRYAYEFPYGQHHDHENAKSADVKDIAGGHKSFLEELSSKKLQEISENGKDLNSSFDMQEAVKNNQVFENISNFQPKPPKYDPLSTCLEPKDEASSHLWEKSKTLVSGVILRKPADTNLKALASPPLSPTMSPKTAKSSWMEDSSYRARIVDDILRKTKLKDLKESDPNIEKVEVGYENKNGEGEKVVQRLVFETKDNEEMKTRKEDNSNKLGVKLVKSELKLIVSEKDKNVARPVSEPFEAKDLSDIGTDSDGALKMKKNTRELQSPAQENEEVRTNCERQPISEEVERISTSQKSSACDKIKPREVLNDRSTKDVPPALADSTESKIVSEIDDSFNLDTNDLSQVSNQCDTPIDSHIKLDSIHGLDDMNSQDTSLLKSMSDEDF